MVVRRHPRTLLGWTATGTMLLVTIDGRQAGYSAGATLYEAMDLLAELGATNAINLDGGGSTTFAMRCDVGACVANRPSEGRQRPVPVALAVVPVAGATSALGASAAVPVSIPALSSVAPPPPAPPTTVAPSTTTSTSTTTVAVAPPSTSASELALPAAPAHAPVRAPARRPAGPAVVAALAIAGWIVTFSKRSLTRKLF